MYCKKCGKEIEEDVDYCKYCGSKVNEVTTEIKLESTYQQTEKKWLKAL